jgi:lysophospholipase L1-like esterase
MYVYCSVISGARYYKRFVRWTPTAQDIGTKTVTVSVYNRKSRELITEKSFTLVVSADAPTNKKIIFIGDSLTQNGIYVHEIQYELSGCKYVSVGTRDVSDVTFPGEPIVQEGRGGWAPNTYTTKYDYLGKTNSFWNPSTNKFDFSYYMSQNGFSGIDCVMLNIGTNGMTHVGDSVSAVNKMIASIKEWNREHNNNAYLPIIISLIIPTNDQNSGGYHYGDWDAAFYKMSQLNYIKRFISEYDGTMENVYLSEPYFNMDTEYDYPSTSVAASSRNPTEVTIHSDPLHPNQYGYLKMADVYYQNLVARLEN